MPHNSQMLFSQRLLHCMRVYMLLYFIQVCIVTSQIHLHVHQLGDEISYANSFIVYTVLNLRKLKKYTQPNRNRFLKYFAIFENVVHSLEPG